ncbi:MAG: holo-ACP synthase [Proteobacteria bacterium]|nr:MAG: holo-ACP synthase [Pseudomonadota bacterium]
MIVGIGVDIVKVSRIKKALERHPRRFIERVLHPNEQTIYQSHSQPLAYFAKRYAAKEALSKALGTGIAKGVNFDEIETCLDALGKPHLRLHGTTLETSKQLGVTQLFISLSDEQDYAIANVVLEG